MAEQHAEATVVVPTFRRPDSLRRALEALAGQNTTVAWEVVVVDNDDEPGAQATFSRVAPLLPVPARLVREHRRGASHSRNRGISEVQTPITVFLDDDVVPEPGWLRHLLEPLVAGRADAVAGRVVFDQQTPRPRWFSQSWDDTVFGAYDRGDTEHMLAPQDYLNTANAAARTAALRAVGGFDPVLGPRDGVPMLDDDVKLYRQLGSIGVRVLYVPDAVVVHELSSARLSRRYIVRREYFRGRSGWLAERERHAMMPFLGSGAALRMLGGDLQAALRAGAWRPAMLYRVAGSLAFTAGYGREALRCLLRGRKVEPSGAWLDRQDGSSARP